MKKKKRKNLCAWNVCAFIKGLNVIKIKCIQYILSWANDRIKKKKEKKNCTKRFNVYKENLRVN